MNRISTTEKPTSPNINWQNRPHQTEPLSSGEDLSQAQRSKTTTSSRMVNQKLPLRQFVRSFGMLGMVVVIPTMLGMATGIWVDTLWPNTHSWFAILAPVGFGLGCLCAVFWSVIDQKTD